MTVQEKITSHPDVINYFRELPFYNKYIEKAKIKLSKHIDLLSELPFYESLNVIKRDCASKGYTMSCKLEIVEKKDPLIQLEASKSSVKDLFKNLLDKTKGFKYQITLKVESEREGEIEFFRVYFKSTTKTVINHKFFLDKSFQEILCRIDKWINEGSGELLNQSSLNILTF